MNKRKEKISAFLDNDMHRDELMSFSLSAELGDAKTAQRYQMVGDALRGEMSDSSFVDVSHAVREALVDENIGDEISAAKSESLSGQLSDSLSGKQGLFNVSAWFRPVAGMAVAASVAVVMVVTLSGQETGALTPVAVNIDQQPVDKQPVVRVAVDESGIVDKAIDNKAAGNKATGNKATGNKATGNKATGNKATGNKAKDIDQRLVNQHLEFATQDAMQGRLPYVRAVSFESKK